MKIKTSDELRELTSVVSELALLRFFPSEPAAMVALVRDIGNMVHTMDDARWLVQRVRQLYNEWPGPMELRAVYCFDFHPADGIKAVSSVYEYGFPDSGMHPPPTHIAGPPVERTPWPDDELQSAAQIVREAAEKSKAKWRSNVHVPSVDEQQFAAKLAEAITSPADRKQLTAADLEAAKAKR